MEVILTDCPAMEVILTDCPAMEVILTDCPAAPSDQLTSQTSLHVIPLLAEYTPVFHHLAMIANECSTKIWVQIMNLWVGMPCRPVGEIR